MKKDSRMCKIKGGDWAEHKEEIRDRVRDASHICVGCFRVSNDEKQLCKPKKIK